MLYNKEIFLKPNYFSILPLTALARVKKPWHELKRQGTSFDWHECFSRGTSGKDVARVKKPWHELKRRGTSFDWHECFSRGTSGKDVARGRVRVVFGYEWHDWHEC